MRTKRKRVSDYAVTVEVAQIVQQQGVWVPLCGGRRCGSDCAGKVGVARIVRWRAASAISDGWRQATLAERLEMVSKTAPENVIQFSHPIFYAVNVNEKKLDWKIG